MAKEITYVNFLRIWIGFVAIMAVGNTVQCFISPGYLFQRLYTVDEQNVSGLSARLFGVWTLLAGGLRFMCAINIRNEVVYQLTLFSFVLALLHFVTEVFVYQTAALTAGIIAPLIVSSSSLVLMLIGLKFINQDVMHLQHEDENQEILQRRSKKKAL